MAKMVSVKDLVAGNVLSDTVNSITGKVLLGKEVVLTARHISLLNTWDIQNVVIDADEENEEVHEEIVQQTSYSTEHHLFTQEYGSIVTNTALYFETIKKRRIIPISHLQDAAGDIHSSITKNNFEVMNYLLMSDQRLAGVIPRHSVMVAYFASIIARQMKWSAKDIAGVAFASLLHDVGNLVTDQIEDPRRKTHIAETAGLLKSAKGIPNEVILGIVQHRECMNSTGFPTGAKGDQIHPYARMIAVADTFHNLAYGDDCINPFPILDMLTCEMYGKFDTDICQNFISKVRNSLLFNKILLSSGQEAEIIFFNRNSYSIPVIKTADNQIIDLSQRKDLAIKQIVIPTQCM